MGTCEPTRSLRARADAVRLSILPFVVAGDARFRHSSIWVTTMRKFVMLQGCVRSARQKQWLEQVVRARADVAIVWNETIVGTAARKR